MSKASSPGDKPESGRTVEEIAESPPSSAIRGYEDLSSREQVCLDLIAKNPEQDFNSLAKNEPVSEESLERVGEEYGDMIAERINELENRRIHTKRGNVSFEGIPLDATIRHLSEINKDPLEEHDIDTEDLTDKQESILRMALRLDFDSYAEIHRQLKSHGHNISYTHVQNEIKKYLESNDESNDESKSKSYPDLEEKSQLAVDLLIEYYGNETDESLHGFYKRKAAIHDISHGTLYNVNNNFQHIIWKWLDERKRE